MTESTYRKIFLPQQEHTNQFAQTPDDVWGILESEFGTFFDPCPANPTQDGLEIEWSKDQVSYVNPPYNSIPLWLEKATEEMQLGRTIVCLLPCRTGANWFHDYLIEQSAEIRFVKQGIKFKGYARKSPFPVCIAVFRPGHTGSPKITSVDFYAS